MKKQVEVVMLPTDKSNVGYRKDYPEQPLFIRDAPLITSNTNTWQAINLYIISDEEIKEGDWCLWKGKIQKATKELVYVAKKIVATTDKSLTTFCPNCEGTGYDNRSQCKRCKNGIGTIPLLQIPQQFQEDFCKAGGIWEVELEYEEAFIHNYELKDKKSNLGHKFKITSNNEVIVHLIESKVYTKEEVENLISKVVENSIAWWNAKIKEKHGDINTSEEFINNWIKENL